MTYTLCLKMFEARMLGASCNAEKCDLQECFIAAPWCSMISGMLLKAKEFVASLAYLHSFFPISQSLPPHAAICQMRRGILPTALRTCVLLSLEQ